MPVCFILDFPGGSLDQYDRVMERMQLGDELPQGAVFHAAGASGDDLRVVDVWESDEAFQRFADSEIGPHTAAEGIAPPQITRIEVNEVRDARELGDEVAFLQVVRLPGIDRDAFEAADAQIVSGDEVPAGLVFHVNGPEGDDWVVADVWASKDVRDTFLAERIQPVMQSAPLTGPPSFDEIDVHNAIGARVAART